MNKGKLIVGLAILILGFFYEDLPFRKAAVVNNEYSRYLTLKKPSDATLDELKDLKTIVSGSDEVYDRELIAIFNSEMAKRLETYDNVNALTFENYYYEAGKMYFEGRIANKYKGLGDKLYKVIIGTLGENESVINKQDFKNLSEKMNGVAWTLLN